MRAHFESLSEANAGSPRWWFGTSKRTPDPRSLPGILNLNQSFDQTKKVIWHQSGSLDILSEIRG